MLLKTPYWYCSHTPHVFCLSKGCLINRKPTWQHYYRRTYWQWYEIVRWHTWNLFLTTILFHLYCLFTLTIWVSHISLIYQFTPTKMRTLTQTIRGKTVAVLNSLQSLLHRITHMTHEDLVEIKLLSLLSKQPAIWMKFHLAVR